MSVFRSADGGRKDGNTQKGQPTQQAPKPTRKGGQPPTIRKPGK